MNYGWQKEPLLPSSPRMSYGQMRMILYQVAPDLHVASARLPGKLDGHILPRHQHRAHRPAHHLHTQTLRARA